MTPLSARTPSGGAARRPGNADRWAVLPVGPATRGPQARTRSQRTRPTRGSTMRASPRSARRCRPEVGVPVPARHLCVRRPLHPAHRSPPTAVQFVKSSLPPTKGRTEQVSTLNKGGSGGGRPKLPRRRYPRRGPPDRGHHLPDRPRTVWPPAKRSGFCGSDRSKSARAVPGGAVNSAPGASSSPPALRKPFFRPSGHLLRSLQS